MFKKILIGAAALVAAAALTADGASARGFGGGGHGGGGGFHGGGGGGFHGGGGGAFRGAAMGGGNAFRGAAVNNGGFRGAAVNPGVARFAAPAVGARFAGGNRDWNGGNWRYHRGGRGFGAGLALGLAGSSYYNSYASYPYDDSYYGDGYYANQYYAGDDAYYAAPDDSSSCYVARRVHTRHGWRLRRVFVCG